MSSYTKRVDAPKSTMIGVYHPNPNHLPKKYDAYKPYSRSDESDEPAPHMPNRSFKAREPANRLAARPEKQNWRKRDYKAANKEIDDEGGWGNKCADKDGGWGTKATDNRDKDDNYPAITGYDDIVNQPTSNDIYKEINFKEVKYEKNQPFMSGGNSGRNCFKCNQEGHFARECPQRSEPPNGKSQGGGVCFKCNQPGHFARECPQIGGDGNGNRGYQSNYGGGSNQQSKGGCFNCGKEGHISRECDQPKVDKPKTCYNCSKEGHISRDCPEPRQQNTRGGGPPRRGRGGGGSYGAPRDRDNGGNNGNIGGDPWSGKDKPDKERWKNDGPVNNEGGGWGNDTTKNSSPKGGDSGGGWGAEASGSPKKAENEGGGW